MDQFTSQLITQGATAAAGAAGGLGRAAIASIESRLRQARETKDQAELIRVQSEIITELSTQCDDLNRGFEALRSQFVAQRLQGEQLAWISSTLLPAIRDFMTLGSDEEPTGDEDSEEPLGEALAIIERLLQPELLEVLQILGFNYQRAIGEPLTEILRRLILRAVPDGQADA